MHTYIYEVSNQFCVSTSQVCKPKMHSSTRITGKQLVAAQTAYVNANSIPSIHNCSCEAGRLRQRRAHCCHKSNHAWQPACGYESSIKCCAPLGSETSADVCSVNAKIHPMVHSDITINLQRCVERSMILISTVKSPFTVGSNACRRSSTPHPYIYSYSYSAAVLEVR